MRTLNLKKLTGLVMVVVALVGIMTSHRNLSAAPAERQLICHVAGDNAFIIQVAEPAVPAHLEHGDCLINSTDTELLNEECDTTDANENDICDIQP